MVWVRKLHASLKSVARGKLSFAKLTHAQSTVTFVYCYYSDYWLFYLSMDFVVLMKLLADNKSHLANLICQIIFIPCFVK